LASGKVSLVQSSKRPGRYIELVGPIDLAVEVVSDSSVKKDNKDLPAAYFLEGVSEFWLVDARGDDLIFIIHRRGKHGFEPVEVDTDGFQRSDLASCRFRLERSRDSLGFWQFDLIQA
jgi:Uma2 family endonuclease